jgi:hypothetical protein
MKNNEGFEIIKSIPNKVYNTLPDVLKRGCDVFKEAHERDIFLIGALGMLSGCLPNIFGLYDNKKLFPNLYFIIVANAGAGKGSMIWSRKMIYLIHQYLIKKKKESTEAMNKMLFIPANVSASALLQALNENDGKGILFSTEADTLNIIIGQDWGNISDLMRSAYHHEIVSLLRKGGEHYEINNPQLSIVLSGTPDQIKTLIPSVENGLFSRFGFFMVKAKSTFKNVFQRHTISYDDHFENLGKELLELYKELEQMPFQLEFSLTLEQEEHFNIMFNQWNNKFVELLGENMVATIRRLGVMVFRIAMIFTVLRAKEEKKDLGEEAKLVCNDIDFQNAMIIIEILLEHVENIFTNLLAKSKNKLNSKQLDFYNKLPNQFDRKCAIELGQEVEISTASVDRLLKKETLFKKMNYGKYEKIG